MSLNGHAACPTGERCFLIMGKQLAPDGQNWFLIPAVIRNFAPPKFRKVKPPTKNTINKECKCGKNREAFINFVVETKK